MQRYTRSLVGLLCEQWNKGQVMCRYRLTSSLCSGTRGFLDLHILEKSKAVPLIACTTSTDIKLNTTIRVLCWCDQTLLEPSIWMVTDRLRLLHCWLGSIEASRSTVAQSSTLLQTPFIMDSVSPKRGQSEPYDTAAGNSLIIKWYTSMSRGPCRPLCACDDFKYNAI